jgi:hypothetical protein
MYINNINDESRPYMEFCFGNNKKYFSQLESQYKRDLLLKNGYFILKINNLDRLFFLTIAQKSLVRCCLADIDSKEAFIINQTQDGSNFMGIRTQKGNKLPFWPDGSNSKCNLLYQIIEPSKLIEFASTSDNESIKKFVIDNRISLSSNPLIRILENERQN